MKTNNSNEDKNKFMQRVRAVFGNKSTNAMDSTSKEATAPANPPTGKKILIVDDDPVYLKATSAMFNYQGYQVVAAKDGSEAIQAMREERPNLVLMDINLDSATGTVAWNGYTLMSWLGRFEDLNKVPVVMVSSSDPLKCVRRALTQGAKAFFHKSTDPNNLVSTVRMLLSEKFPTTQRTATGNFQI